MAVPLRMCAIGRELKPKNELIRLVKVDNKVLIDEKQKLQGRGVWICLDENCLSKLKKSKCLNRAFKCEVDEEIYAKILEKANDRKWNFKIYKLL